MTDDLLSVRRSDSDTLVVCLSGAWQLRAQLPSLSVVEQDVMSALLNLGCNRAAAEAAVRKAKTAGAPAEFEPLFRKSLELVR